MARLIVWEGGERLQKAYLSLADAIKAEGADRALIKGGEILVERFKQSVDGVVHDHRSTGELSASIKADAPKGGGARGRYVDVYPHGSRSDGKRNAEIGAYHEYGVMRSPPKKSQRASHWMSNAVDDSREEVLDAMETSILETIDTHLGG